MSEYKLFRLYRTFHPVEQLIPVRKLCYHGKPPTPAGPSLQPIVARFEDLMACFTVIIPHLERARILKATASLAPSAPHDREAVDIINSTWLPIYTASNYNKPQSIFNDEQRDFLVFFETELTEPKIPPDMVTAAAQKAVCDIISLFQRSSKLSINKLASAILKRYSQTTAPNGTTPSIPDPLWPHLYIWLIFLDCFNEYPEAIMPLEHSMAYFTLVLVGDIKTLIADDDFSSDIVMDDTCQHNDGYTTV
ncbi:hypothetical protein Dda_6988 [Drechslerella dactyloides]|uniref:Uncharacterized protein n=1 Tax=Drechslerella dactyloides TaxID=74499 RepID=A0AAD6IUY6_DREDA|nr:hypothetical protein Dda_6988 [Drechslerella dactyloides]